MKRLLVGMLATTLALAPTIASAAPGDPDPGFGSGGVVTNGLLDRFGSVTVDPQGRTVVVGVKLDTADAGHVAIARYLADGTPDTSFSSDGRADLSITAATFQAFDVRVLADGSIVSFGYRTSDPADPFSNGVWGAKVTETGSPASGYGTNGVTTEEYGYTVGQIRGSIGADGAAIAYQRDLGSSYLIRLSPTGVYSNPTTVFDDGVLPSGCVVSGAVGPQNGLGAAYTSASELVHAIEVYVGDAGGCPLDSEPAVLVVKQTVSGTEIWTRAIYPGEVRPESGDAVALLDGDIVVATTSVSGTTQFVHRFSSAGVPVAGWGTNGRATLAAGFGQIGGMAALPGGKLALISGVDGSAAALRIERLSSNGSTDASFPRQTIQVGGTLLSADVAGAPDGDVVVTTQREGQGTVRHLIGSDAGTTDPEIAPLEPGRLLETRKGADYTTIDGLFQGAGQRPADSITKVKIAGRGNVPADATAAMLNLVAVRPTGPGFLTIFPCTPTRPNAATLNYGPGTVVANAVFAKLSTNGEICIYTKAASDLVIDVNGYVPASSEIGNVDPGRLLETRKGADYTTIDGLFQGAGQRPADSITKVKIAGRGNVPADATAAMLNLVAVRPTGPGFLTIFPCTPTRPNAATLNYGPGTVVANAVFAKLSTNGEICIYTKAASDLVIDVNGYVPASSEIGNVDPGRLLETRKGADYTTIDGLFQGAGQRPADSITKVKIAGRGNVPADATAAMLNLVAVRPTGPGFLTIFPCTPTRPNAATLNYGPGTVVANAVFAKLSTNGEICIYTKAASDLVIDVNGYVPG